MGIIQKQALRNTLINFFGAGFGGIVRVVIMPLFITPAQIGLLTILDFISGVFTLIFGMGYDQIVIKLFPKYRNEENGHHGFLLLGIFLSLLGILLSFILYYFLGDYFLDDDTDIALFKRFAFLIFPLIFFRVLFINTDHYVRMLFNTVIGVFLENVVSKIVIALSIILFGFAWINFDELVYLYAFSFCVPGIIVLIYALRKTKKIVLPHRSIFEQSKRKDLYQYMLFGLLMGASGSIVLYVDALMIGNMLSLTAVGIYSTFFMAARLMTIASRSINRIAGVVLAEAWANNDKETIKDVYEKTCLNQLLIGAYMLGVGWVCIGPAISLSPKLTEYAQHKYVFLILGLGLLVEMATGANAAIIATSKKYKFNTYFTVLLTFLVVVLNFIFIQKFEILGAAIASMIAMVVINFLRWYFLLRTYKLQPFKVDFLKALILSIAFLIFCYYFDYNASPLLKIALNLISLTIIFWGLVVGFRLSVDVNKWLLKMKNKFF